LPVLVLGLWFVAEFCLFYQHVRREVLWAFPGYWDQVRYLQESHDIYRDIFANGLTHGLIRAVTTPTPNGKLLPTEAAVLYIFLGGSRLTALLLLFVHWIVFQTIAVTTIRWLSGRWSVAIMALALLLLVASPFQESGGLVDFRIDFAAGCAFGVFLCLAIRSNLFANRHEGILAGLVASYLILLRFITLVYLGVIGAMFSIAVFMVWMFKRQPSADRERNRMRLLNLALIGGLVLAICLPVFWHNRKAIQEYYVVGHATGPEKYIRAQEAGVGNELDSILYYPRSVWMEHAGPDFRKAAGVLILLSLLALGVRGKPDKAADVLPLSERLDVPMAYLFLFAGLLGPYLVLTSDMSKSPVVGNIFIPTLWAMVMLAVVCAAESVRSPVQRPWLRYVPTGLAVIFFSMAVSYQVYAFGQPSRFTQQRGDVERVLELHDLIGQKCREEGLQSPLIAVDRASDAFFPGVVSATQRERHQIMLSARPAYPEGIFAVTEDEVIPGLHQADFVLLTLSGSEGPPYPFDTSMEAMLPKLLDICDREMLRLRDTSFLGRRVRLYMRPSVRVETTYPDWAGEEGTTLYGETAALRRFPSITMRGATFGNLHFPDDDRTVTATLEIEDHSPQSIPATYVDTNGQYTIHLSVPSLDTANEGMVEIRLHFHHFFVPRELGLNDDPRHLVVRPPTSVHLDQPTASSTPSTSFP
jgi:hypothetical protein